MRSTFMDLFKSLMAILPLLQYTNAWVLDKRCDDLGYGDLVRGGMVRALEFAQAAQDTLQSLKDGTNNEAQMDLFQYMFGYAIETIGNERRIKILEWDTIYSKYTDVLNFAPVRQSNGDIPTDDVVIYCDYSRYIEGKNCKGDKDKSLACDKDTFISHIINFAWKQCKKTVAFGPVMALTSSNGARRFGQIDLCTWYLKFVSTSEKQFWSDIGRKSRLVRPVHQIFNSLYLRREMDASALLDHTILHELTHALSVGDTDDVKGYRSYGWRRCIEIGKTPDARGNAENYAYFGLAARMISPKAGTPATRPNKDGSISTLTEVTQNRNEDH